MTNDLKFFYIQSKCLNIIGLSISETSKRRSFRSFINFVLIFVLLMSQFVALQGSLGDTQVLCHLLGLVVGVFLSMIKISATIHQIEEFAELVSRVKELSKDVNNEDKKKLITMNKIAQTLSLINIVCLLTSTIILILYPLALTLVQFYLFEDDDDLLWPIPFDATFPFDTSYSPVYELVYIFTIYTFVTTCFSINACDSTFLEACLLLYCHFEFLQRDIENINYDRVDDELRKIFDYHGRILTAKKSLEEAYRGILPAFCIISPFMFGLFVISALKSPGVTVFKSLGYAISTLCQIFFYTYGGDIITRSSLTISQSYYNSNWYEAQPKARRNVITAIIMAQEGTTIRAGLMDLNLNTFAKVKSGKTRRRNKIVTKFRLQILKSTYTMITVLSSVFD